MKLRSAIASSSRARLFEAAAVLGLLAAWSAVWVWFCCARGYICYYGDAEAHLNIARRIVDSRTPGYDELGTVWLPLPHVMMLPLAANDGLWRSGLAGAIPSAIYFVLAGGFLFAAVRRIFDSALAAATAVVVFAANPNILYLQATPMTEPLFWAALMATLYFTVLFRDTQSWSAVAGAGIAVLCGTLARYEAWFLIPFAGLFVLIAGRRRRFGMALVFAAIACLGPLYWLGHNWWCCSNVLEFYNGPYSAKAIQGRTHYPGAGDWGKAWLYFRTAARWCAGVPLLWLGGGGLAACMVMRRSRWPAGLLLLPAVFYVWSVHSSGTPIFVPDLWTKSYYNTRYGLALFPALALGGGALVMLAPRRARWAAAIVIVILSTAPWLLDRRPDSWITWKESQVNSVARRAWTREATDYLGPRYRRDTGIITTFGDITGIYRRLGLPLRETLTWDNWPLWPAAVARPDLFLREEWAVVTGGDPVQTALWRAGADGPRYELVKRILVPGAPAIEIYHCCIGLTPVTKEESKDALGSGPGPGWHGP